MKTAFITGASRGIGLAIAEALKEDGYTLFLNCRHMETLEPICQRLEAHPVCFDAGSFEAAAAAFDACVWPYVDHIDLLVNNAGISYVGLLQDMDPDDWSRVISTNLTSVFNLSKLVLPGMIRRQTGNIVNISSIWGQTGASMEVAYSASKGGVDALTRALAREVAPSGIRVNAVACGVIDTTMNAHLDPQEKTDLANEIGLGRFGRTEEIASVVRFLASESASYITGQILTVDGAMI
ncbi:MAG: SDR family oxidoreductase [Clostridiales bacterium]|nr:SDR family oxidoreductase [Clostridiales bacterium]